MITTPTDHGRRQSLFSAEFRRSTLALAALPFLVAFEMPAALGALVGVAVRPRRRGGALRATVSS